MIAASEPLEFVPHGRTVVAKHPGQIYNKNQNSSASENSLLYKLTNFAIKDESLVEGKENEDKEWWCVREVYYRDTEDEESSSSNKDDCMSESFRPQSRLKSEFNISIKSELMGNTKKHEECVNSAGTSRGGSANSSSNMSKKFNLTPGHKSPKKKRHNPKTDCSYEEELYVNGCTAVWSKGFISTPASKLAGAEQRETVCCYTIDNPIKHATFCNFHVTINNTMLIDALNSQIGDVKKNIKIEDTTQHIPHEDMPSILLIDNKCMKVYAKDGREYINSIPFQVKRVWPMKYGVLLEKEGPLIHNSFLPTSFMKLNDSHNSSHSKLSKTNYPFSLSAKLRSESISGYDNEVMLPTCFSLSHPLDEVTPVLIKSSQGLQYFNDGDLQIIFVSTSPSIVLLYDCKLGIHSLWKVRQALRDECLLMCPNLNSSTTGFSQSCDFIGSPMASHLKNAASLGSPCNSKKGPGTPTLHRSKLNTPLANKFHQQGLSPHTSIGQASSTSMLANTFTQGPPALPLYPEICLDHIWTDNQKLIRDDTDNSKTFLHTDLVGQDYLCFMVKTNGVGRLQVLRLQKPHSQGQSTSNLIVGSTSWVSAKDAVVLEHLRMIALIDECGNIILQSGNNLVGKVHVGGVLARLIDSSYARRATFQSPLPRRSSLLPTRHDASFGDSALHLLSPVPHTSTSRIEQKEALGLSGLCDATGSRVTLQFDSGALYRIALPPAACSSLVGRCCTALQAILPKDITMQVLIKWYGIRNAPGTQDVTPEQEWTMFSNLLYSLVGYDVEKLSVIKQNDEHVDNAEVATKKQRTSCDGTQDDWDYLLNSKLHKTIGSSLASMLNLRIPSAEKSRQATKNESEDKPTQFNSNGLLFPYTFQVLYTLHLAYEETKLNTLLYNDLRLLAGILCQLSKDLRLTKYVNHYWLDFPMDLNLDYEESDSQLSEDLVQKIIQPNYFTTEPPHIFEYINAMMKDIDTGYYPHLSEVNNRCRDIIEALTVVGCGRSAGVHGVTSRDGISSSTPRPSTREASEHSSPYCQAVVALCERGIRTEDIDKLPAGVALPILTACCRSRASPPAAWRAGPCQLAAREDLALQAQLADVVSSPTEYMESLALEVLEKETAFSLVSGAVEEPAAKGEEESLTGMEHLNTKLLALLYPNDHRMTEVMNLLQSSLPVSINLTQRPDVSDHDFIEEQEKQLFALTTRTTALPVARGMVTLRSRACGPAAVARVPKLCVSGRGPPPRRAAVPAPEPAPPRPWPAFHSGAAAGLALVPLTGCTIDSSWIIYNKPRGTTEMSAEHAGFLMGLGLNGQLKDMPFMNIYEYLVKCHEMVSIGLLLGLAATYKGSMDVQATKVMSIHLEPLLPSTSIEMDIQQNILVAALLGVGLIYQGTNNTHYAQVLLNEIGKPVCGGWEGGEQGGAREAYALAGALALGLVCAGAAERAPPSAPQRLRNYMLPPNHRDSAHSGSQKDKYRQNSATREGSTVNLDVTSPGATLALGLVYFRSNNTALASWLQPPTTAYQLDFVRPDLLMLRIIARGLVLWDSIEASEEWVESQVPETIRPYCFVKPTEENIDYEAMNQAYCNIVAGACFALGLRFAGSGCEEARDAALGGARRMLACAASPLHALPGRATLEACLAVCLLAAGMIMCGRGDVSVLRLCRRLRARSQPALALSHGGQMAVHCAVGLLFLGGGRATLSTSPTAVAALVAAFFPKFPTHSEDNRYHLQAFRHLYVLAVEPRLILPRDIDTGKLCYAHVQVVDLSGNARELRAPCMLPELDTLREVRVRDARYWPVVFQRGRNWEQLKTYLDYTWCIDIKQRAGCLSYTDDPQGYMTILAQALTLDKSNLWSVSPDNIKLFTNDEKIMNFVKHYLNKESSGTSICADCLVLSKKRKGVKGECGLSRECSCRRHSVEEQEYLQGLSMATYECVVKDILCVLPVWTTFLKIIKTMKQNPSTYHIWQIKLLLSQLENHNRQAMSEMKVDGQDAQNEPLISNEFALAIKLKVTSILDKWEPDIAPYIRKYLGLPSSRKLSQCDDDVKKSLATFIVFNDLPRGCLRNSSCDNELELIMGVEGMSVEAMSKVESLVR